MALNIVPFFSPVSPEGLNREILNEINQKGVTIIREGGKIPLNEPVYLFIGTGGTENIVARFLESNSISSPIVILSYDERNSLPAAMEIRAYLEQRGVSARIVHNSLAQLSTLLKRWSTFTQIQDILKRSKLGLIGQPSSWLIASNVNPDSVFRRWGLKIIDIPISELIENLPNEIAPEFKTQVETFQNKATCQSVSISEIRRAGIIAERISKIVDKADLNALSVQCFKLLQDTGVSGCFSLSYLNDKQNFVAGCEGDIPATFTMLLAKLLTGNPSFMANVASVDQDRNTVVFAHCTVPTSLTDEYEITNHFETGKSVGIRGKLALKDVTVVKIFGDDLSQLWVSSGTIIDNLVNDKGCRTQIRVAMDDPVDYFLEESLANHHIVILGNFVPDFVEFFDFMENHRSR